MYLANRNYLKEFNFMVCKALLTSCRKTASWNKKDLTLSLKEYIKVENQDKYYKVHITTLLFFVPVLELNSDRTGAILDIYKIQSLVPSSLIQNKA